MKTNVLAILMGALIIVLATQAEPISGFLGYFTGALFILGAALNLAKNR